MIKAMNKIMSAEEEAELANAKRSTQRQVSQALNYLELRDQQ